MQYKIINIKFIFIEDFPRIFLNFFLSACCCLLINFPSFPFVLLLRSPSRLFIRIFHE